MHEKKGAVYVKAKKPYLKQKPLATIEHRNNKIASTPCICSCTIKAWLVRLSVLLCLKPKQGRTNQITDHYSNPTMQQMHCAYGTLLSNSLFLFSTPLRSYQHLLSPWNLHWRAVYTHYYHPFFFAIFIFFKPTVRSGCSTRRKFSCHTFVSNCLFTFRFFTFRFFHYFKEASTVWYQLCLAQRGGQKPPAKNKSITHNWQGK